MRNGHPKFTLFNTWKKTTFFHSTHRDGSGGAVIGLAPWIAKFVIDNGEDPSHCCVWVHTIINAQPIGFCSIYAPNDPKNRTSLWDWTVNNLPNADWVLGGDFNMVEKHVDHSWYIYCKLGKE